MSAPASPAPPGAERVIERAPAGGAGRLAVPRQRRVALAVQIVRFGLVGLVALTVIALVADLRIRRSITDAALRDGIDRAELIADTLVRPRVTGALLAGDLQAVAEMDSVVQGFVVRDPLVRVKVWTSDGLIVYADEHRLIGRSFALDDDVRSVLTTGRPYADLSTLQAAENVFEHGETQLIEVYVPLQLPSGATVIYEDYQRFSVVSQSARRLASAFSPTLVGSLLALELGQLPLAWFLGRRLRAAHARQSALLQQALDATDVERRRLAHDLHDGIVQELVGVTYTLNAVRQAPDVRTRPGLEGALGQAADGTQRSLVGLRTLLVDLYPPTLADGDLAGALSDLLAPLRGAGVAAELRFDASAAPGEATRALLYRVAREALKNVAHHAAARRVEVSVGPLGADAVALTVADDGRGFDAATYAAQADAGHLGLRLLGDTVVAAGGRLTVDGGPGRGTIVRVELPR